MVKTLGLVSNLQAPISKVLQKVSFIKLPRVFFIAKPKPTQLSNKTGLRPVSRQRLITGWPAQKLQDGGREGGLW